MNFKKAISLALVSITALTLSLSIGCAGGGPEKIDSSGLPEWVSRANAAYEDGGVKAIYAVGLAANNPNPAARRSMAVTRARSELGKVLSTQVQSMVKDYMATNRDFYDMDNASSKEYFESISRQVSNETLSGAIMINSYADKSDGTYYVLYKLPFESVIGSYKTEMKKAAARERQRKKIKMSAEDFEAKMDVQIDKLNAADAAELNNLGG